MRALLAHWEEVSEKLRRAPHRLWLFDFDGTLAPIASHPKHVRFRPQLQKLLRELSRRPASAVGVVSGRSLHDLRAVVGIPGLIHAGNHGLELSIDRTRWSHPQARASRSSVHRAGREISRKIFSIPGAWVEDKGLTLTVHFREVSPGRVAGIRRIVLKVLLTPEFRRRFYVLEEKKDFDILPRINWDKGSVVKKLIQRSPRRTAVLYVGDDTTDEDAFEVVRSRGIAVNIGRRRRSIAPYYLKNQGQVKQLLEKLIEL